MFQYLKYLPKILFGFKDVSDQYKEETGNNRPVILSRTFINSLVCFLATIASVALGVDFDDGQVKVVADNTATIILAGVGLYTAIMSFVAQVKSKRNEPKE